MTVQLYKRTLPSSIADWRRITRVVRDVLSVPRYAAIALAAAVLALSVFVVAVNLPVVHLALFGTMPLAVRTGILLRLYPFVGTGFGALAGGALVSVAGVFGVATALLTHQRRRHDAVDSRGDASGSGAAVIAFTAGCVACGSALVVGSLTLLGVSWTVLVLPLDGVEFALPALVAFLLSIHWVAVEAANERPADTPGHRPGI